MWDNKLQEAALIYRGLLDQGSELRQSELLQGNEEQHSQ